MNAKLIQFQGTSLNLAPRTRISVPKRLHVGDFACQNNSTLKYPTVCWSSEDGEMIKGFSKNSRFVEILEDSHLLKSRIHSLKFSRKQSFQHNFCVINILKLMLQHISIGKEIFFILSKILFIKSTKFLQKTSYIDKCVYDYKKHEN